MAPTIAPRLAAPRQDSPLPCAVLPVPRPRAGVNTRCCAARRAAAGTHRPGLPAPRAAAAVIAVVGPQGGYRVFRDGRAVTVCDEPPREAVELAVARMTVWL